MSHFGRGPLETVRGSGHGEFGGGGPHTTITFRQMDERPRLSWIEKPLTATSYHLKCLKPAGLSKGGGILCPLSEPGVPPPPPRYEKLTESPTTDRTEKKKSLWLVFYPPSLVLISLILTKCSDMEGVVGVMVGGGSFVVPVSYMDDVVWM